MCGMRIDRCVTLYIAGRFRDFANGSQCPRATILMYHSISDEQNRSVHPYYEINTSPKVFGSHMEFLWANKYEIISLRDIDKSLNAAKDLAKNYVVITFDDAYRSVYENAFPILKKYCYTATIFVPTDFLDYGGGDFQERSCINWEEAEALKNAGFSFGSHTASHRRLTNLETREIEYELKHSKELIERRLGVEVESFSYPFSFPDGNKAFLRKFRQLAQKTGYKYVVTTNIGTVASDDDRYFLKRIPVNSWDDPRLFHAKLNGGYDWVRIPQYLFKAYVKQWK
ncbi:MAG: hypothetical protein Kow00128_11870 [Deltaproteobacteria bacterium]